jgi:hypothetical protein
VTLLHSVCEVLVSFNQALPQNVLDPLDDCLSPLQPQPTQETPPNHKFTYLMMGQDYEPGCRYIDLTMSLFAKVFKQSQLTKTNKD